MRIGPGVLLAALSVSVAVVGAYGEKLVSRQARKDRVTVIYWEKWNGAEADAVRDVVNAFNKSQDRIFVRYLSISGVDRKTLLATAGGDPPDIAGVWQETVPLFADANALEDLSDLAKASGLSRDYYIPAYWDALFYRDKLWGVPSTPASIALHVRTDLVPPEFSTPETFPKTIEGLDKLTDRISKKKKDGTIELAGFLPSNPGWWQWAWGYLFGGTLMKDDKVTANSAENLRAFTWIGTYAEKFGVSEVQSFKSGFGNFSSPEDPFMQGKVATEMNGVWKANYIRVFKPDLKWFAVPLPYPEDRPDLKDHAILSQDILVIPRGAKHVKEAFEFLRYVQRQDVMEGLCAAHGKNSPLEKVSEHFFNTHPNKFIRLFDKLARSPKAVAQPKYGIYNQLNTEMGVAFEAISAKQKTPKQALDDAQKRLEEQWDTYQRQVLNRK